MDNDGNGYVDEISDQEWGIPSAAGAALIADSLNKHTHKTARSECLYALLVGGVGPLGSTFSADDFTSKEVGDSDGDGLPEFLDAWGQPLQFYRWPTHYISPLQRGWSNLDANGTATGPYSGMTEPRDTAAYDPNNQLVAPAWWSGTFNTNVVSGFTPPTGAAYSSPAYAVMSYFVSLVDSAAWPMGIGWDRSGVSVRRQYFCRPLIISSGPDQKLGVGQLAFDYSNYGVFAGSVDMSVAHPGQLDPTKVLDLIQIENTAANLSPNRDKTKPLLPEASGDVVGPAMRTDWGLDDISNQSLQTAIGGVK